LYLNTLRYYELPGGKDRLTGQGIGVVVVDSGVSPYTDFGDLVRVSSFNSNSRTPNDVYGHGTHVAGIIAGAGTDSNEKYRGVAPKVRLISVKISDEAGMAYESDTLEAMQWIYLNKEAYNIRVVNLSINAAQESSYHTSPLDAGVEFLWFNGIVVVASAGNRGATDEAHTLITPPANDPFIITVGATNEQGTAERGDDIVAPYSAWGHTVDGFLKPDIMAPGSHIYSVLSKNSRWGVYHPDRVSPSGEYFRLSGTSMSAPMVAGAVALLLEAEPALTPDQVKFRLLHSGSPLPVFHAGSYQFDIPYLDLYSSIAAPTSEAANRGLMPSFLLLAVLQNAIDWSSVEPDGIDWNSVNWNSVNWNSVNWNSVNWNSVNWNSVNWNSVNWNSVNWNSVNWNSVNWNSVNWNSVNWNSVNWNSAVLESEDAPMAGATGAAAWSVPAWPAAGDVDQAEAPSQPAAPSQHRLYLPLTSR
jgi:serine protease AprX